VPYWGIPDLGYIDELHILRTQVAYTPTPTATNLVANNGNVAETYPGDPVSVDLNIQNAENLYAAQALCEVDPSVLELQDGGFGDFFDPTLRLIAANQTDTSTGEWLGAISQQNPAGPLSGNGLFATLNYIAAAPGMTNLTCEPLFSDRDGSSLPVSYGGTNITVLAFGVVNGSAHYQGRINHAGIDVTATGILTLSDTTDSAGSYSLDQLKAGTYDVKVDAALYLPACASDIVVTSGQTVTLDTATLLGGDLNDDEMINIGDVSRLGSAFGTSDPGADINADGVVNVQDLAIIGGNYEVSGCQLIVY
jgi:hypothetical protein